MTPTSYRTGSEIRLFVGIMSHKHALGGWHFNVFLTSLLKTPTKGMDE